MIAAVVAAVSLLALLLAFRPQIGAARGANPTGGGGAGQSVGATESSRGNSGSSSPGQGSTDSPGKTAHESAGREVGETAPVPDTANDPAPKRSADADHAPQPEAPLANESRPVATLSASRGSRIGNDRSSGLAGGDGEGDKEGGAEFFGIGTPGKRFIYVVDASGSMQGEPFASASQELRRSIRKLSDVQQFSVIFFNDRSYALPKREGKMLWSANDVAIRAFEQWLTGIHPAGGTFPEDALRQALQAEPDAIYFLTDGQFDSAVVDFVRNNSRQRTVINTIGFGSGAAKSPLEEIAKITGGSFRSVP